MKSAMATFMPSYNVTGEVSVFAIQGRIQLFGGITTALATSIVCCNLSIRHGLPCSENQPNTSISLFGGMVTVSQNVTLIGWLEVVAEVTRSKVISQFTMFMTLMFL